MLSHIAIGTLYFSIHATLALGSVLFSIPFRAMQTQPALVNQTQSPGTQQGTVHVRD